MNDIEILELIRAEIMQIMDNYTGSYNITRGGVTQKLQLTEVQLEEAKRLIEFAHNVYGAALQRVEFLIDLKKKK